MPLWKGKAWELNVIGCLCPFLDTEAAISDFEILALHFSEKMRLSFEKVCVGGEIPLK